MPPKNFKQVSKMRISTKPELQINDDDLKILHKTSVSRTEPHRSVIRAKILLMYYEGKRISQIAKEQKTNRPLVERTINRALAYGVIQGLKDLPGRGAKPTITDDAKSWVLFTCTVLYSINVRSTRYCLRKTNLLWIFV